LQEGIHARCSCASCGERHRGCFQQPDGWSSRSCNGAVKLAPSDRLFVGGCSCPMLLSDLGEEHRGCFQQPDGWSSRSYNGAVKLAPSDRLFVGGCSRPMLLCELRGKASRLLSTAGWLVKPLLQWSGEARAVGPALCRRAFMPDALVRAAGKGIAAAFNSRMAGQAAPCMLILSSAVKY
jgi:hypothetical protein